MSSSVTGRRARLLVIAAPSGAGKTTLVRALLDRNPSLSFSISYTTRKKRETEQDGRDYFFVTEDRFAQLEAEGELLESAQVFDNRYGTGRAQVEARLAEGRDVILEIDWQGARQVRQTMPECDSVFILPPSLQELERRLRDRRTDSEAVIARFENERRVLSALNHNNIARLYDGGTTEDGDDGTGDQFQGAPNLADGIWLYGGSHDAIRQTISGGRGGMMPSFHARLTPEEVAP